MTTVSSGQTLDVQFATSSGITVLSNGTLDANDDGTVVNTFDSGGTVAVYGNVATIGKSIQTTLTAGGIEDVLAHGIASGTLVGFDSEQDIDSGGTASGTIVSGGLDQEDVNAGGTAFSRRSTTEASRKGAAVPLAAPRSTAAARGPSNPAARRSAPLSAAADSSASGSLQDSSAASPAAPSSTAAATRSSRPAARPAAPW